MLAIANPRSTLENGGAKVGRGGDEIIPLRAM
jgi:hypothetical protein